MEYQKKKKPATLRKEHKQPTQSSQHQFRSRKIAEREQQYIQKKNVRLANVPRLFKKQGGTIVHLHEFLTAHVHTVASLRGHRLDPAHFLKSSLTRPLLALITDLNDDSVLRDFKEMRSMMFSKYYGVTMPTFKLRSSGPFNVTSSVGGLITTVVQVDFFSMANYAAYGIFDEYRFNGPCTIYYRAQSPANTTSYNAVGVVDFDSSNVLTGSGDARGYDSSQIFCLNPSIVNAHSSSNSSSVAQWVVKLLGQPDLVWTTTAVNYQPCWWKSYNWSSSIASSTTFGMIDYSAEITFRQLT